MLVDDLKKVVKGEVWDDSKTLDTYSRDASIFQVKPKVVVAPKDVEDVKALVHFVSAEHKTKSPASRLLSLTARSGGTDMSGGSLSDSIVIDFTKYFNHIGIIGKDYGVVEPGAYFRDFEKVITEKGLMLPSYPASKGICTVGGMVANNSGGEKTLAYGKTEKYVMELNVVMSDGEEHVIRPLSAAELGEKIKERSFEGKLYKEIFELIEKNYEVIQKARPDVSKNSAGYFLWNVWDRKTFDLPKLIVGSQGTLGFVTNIKFKLVRRKKYSRLLAVFLKDLDPLVEVIHSVLKFNPESFESFDDHTLNLALKFFPDMVKVLKGNIISLGFQFLPEFWMLVTGGIPKLVLLVELTGDNQTEVDTRAKKLLETLRPFSVKLRLTRNAKEAEKYWTIRRESFNLLRKRVKDKHTAPFIDDIIVRPEKLPEFLPKLNAILAKYENKMIYTIAGHPGDGNFHIIPLMNLDAPGTHELIHTLSDLVYDLVLEYGGSITAEHNDGLIRSPYLEKMYGKKVIHLFEQTKDIFDPLAIFNPRKKVHSDLNYSLAHIQRI